MQNFKDKLLARVAASNLNSPSNDSNSPFSRFSTSMSNSTEFQTSHSNKSKILNRKKLVIFIVKKITNLSFFF